MVAVTIGAVLLLYGLALQVYYAEANSRDIGPLLAVLIGTYALYEIWAFFHGRTTSIDRLFHEPRPENTRWRSVGLLGDLLVLAFALSILFRIN